MANKQEKLKKTFYLKNLKRLRELIEQYPHIEVDESTFTSFKKPAKFIDSEYGEWWVNPASIFGVKKAQHPKRALKEKGLKARLSLPEVIERLKKERPELTIVESTYQKASSLATFIDAEYGEFEFTVSKVLAGVGMHPKRRKVSPAAPQEVEAKIQQDRPYISLDYSTFNTMNNKARFIDKDLGEWWATPSMVVGTKNRPGSNHPDRYLFNLRLTADEIQRRITEGFNDVPPRDYLFLKKESYVDTTKKAIFVDSEHGEFEAFPYTILNGVNHVKRSRKYDWSKEFIEEKLKERPIKIDYDTYEFASIKARFIDEKYGEWWAKPHDVVIKGTNHPQRVIDDSCTDPETVQDRITNGWNSYLPRDFITLDKETFVNYKTKARFIDSEYDEWWTGPLSVLQGSNHPSRAYRSTSIERKVAEFFQIERNCQTFKTIVNSYIKPDFVINNLFIECDGLYWHSELKRHKDHHWLRRELCEQLGYEILQFREDEINNRFPIVCSIIGNKLGKSERLYARKLKLKELPPSEAYQFFEENHLMGGTRLKAFGLFYENKLVQAMSFQSRKDGVHIGRFCSRLNTQVVGGQSKLLKAIKQRFPDKAIINFVDLRYGSGKHLENFGFKLEKITLGWKWTDGKYTYNRLKCRANMDERKLTQAEHAAELGWYKIYDAGQAKYVLEVPGLS